MLREKGHVKIVEGQEHYLGVLMVLLLGREIWYFKEDEKGTEWTGEKGSEYGGRGRSKAMVAKPGKEVVVTFLARKEPWAEYVQLYKIASRAVPTGWEN